MQINLYNDYYELSLHAARTILAAIKKRPEALLVLATGDSPRLTYQLLCEQARQTHTDFSQCTLVALDEWVGIPPSNEGSCAWFFHNLLMKPLNLSSAQVQVFNGLAIDLRDECRKMDELIFRKGGIDLMVVGIGMNGHIGFNEPGVSQELYSHVIELDPVTQAVGQKYFKEQTSLRYGITLGLKHLKESKEVLLLASGSKKASIVRAALNGPVSSQVPASILQVHANSVIMLDEAAAAELPRNERNQVII
jgi:galactosamine-6-phosphate isomerase